MRKTGKRPCPRAPLLCHPPQRPHTTARQMWVATSTIPGRATHPSAERRWVSGRPGCLQGHASFRSGSICLLTLPGDKEYDLTGAGGAADLLSPPPAQQMGDPCSPSPSCLLWSSSYQPCLQPVTQFSDSQKRKQEPEAPREPQRLWSHRAASSLSRTPPR